MWYKKICSLILLFAVIMASVKGSCLEYGHSCWGAHGKRSGGGRLVHGGPSFANAAANEMNMFAENAEGTPIPKHETAFENFDELNASAENGPSQTADREKAVEAVGPSDMVDESNKLKSILRRQLQQHLKYRNERLQQIAAKLNGLDSGEQHTHSGADKWRTLPLFNLKNYVQAGADNSELQQEPRQQFERKISPRYHDEDNVLYDLN